VGIIGRIFSSKTSYQYFQGELIHMTFSIFWGLITQFVVSVVLSRLNLFIF
jgi:hypothetical protein